MEESYWVVGLGLSGSAAAYELERRGATVFRWDDGQGIGQYPDHLERLTACVLSPGISQDHPIVCQSVAAGVEVVGEAELALRLHDRPMVAITGTNGKTTTTLLVEAILNEAGVPARAMGNIGRALTEELSDLPPEVLPVVELSSYQLETVTSRRFKAAVILNITPDHLDRYPSFEAYAAAKFQIAQCMRPDGVLYVQESLLHQIPDCDPLTFLGDSSIAHLSHYPLCSTLKSLFSACNAKSVSSTNLQKTNWVTIRGQMESGVVSISDCVGLGLEGFIPSMRENISAAYCLCRHWGVSWEQCLESALHFHAPAHRIEHVRDRLGVHYYDDSKGTNLAAVEVAVEAMQGPVILIAGGKHKGTPYTSWIQGFNGRVRQLLAIGEAASHLEMELADVLSVRRCTDLAEAVICAAELAQPGDCVLLSPGCSSFDMFQNYEDRGRCFQELVKALPSVIQE